MGSCNRPPPGPRGAGLGPAPGDTSVAGSCLPAVDHSQARPPRGAGRTLGLDFGDGAGPPPLGHRHLPSPRGLSAGRRAGPSHRRSEHVLSVASRRLRKPVSGAASRRGTPPRQTSGPKPRCGISSGASSSAASRGFPKWALVKGWGGATTCIDGSRRDVGGSRRGLGPPGVGGARRCGGGRPAAEFVARGRRRELALAPLAGGFEAWVQGAALMHRAFATPRLGAGEGCSSSGAVSWSVRGRGGGGSVTQLFHVSDFGLRFTLYALTSPKPRCVRMWVCIAPRCRCPCVPASDES